MTSMTELFGRLQAFEATQKQQQAEQEELRGLIECMKKELDLVKGISNQLKQYFEIVSEQNKQLLSPKANQPEVTMSDVLELIREMKSDG